MIIIRLAGGLANRMFQYAYYLHLCNIGRNVALDDVYRPTKWEFEKVSLQQIFPFTQYKRATTLQILSLCGGNDFFSKILRRLPPIKGHLVRKQFLHNFEELAKINGNVYVIGTFSSLRYFSDVEEKIRQEFQFTQFQEEKNSNMQRKFSMCESVAIHIRKGKDYNRKNMHGTCDVEYYNNAFQYIKERVNNPQFYIFTDNREWVTQNIKSINYTLIDWNPVSGVGNHYDMQLMSNAKHNIIANSTYSWWGAYLNSNPNKIVIAPKKWFNIEVIKKNSQELGFIPENWIVL